MNSVWVVQGEYDDRILGIFSEEEPAKTFCAHRPGASYEEWPLSTWSEEQIKFVFIFDLFGNVVYEQEEATIQPLSGKVIAFTDSAVCVCIEVHRGPRDYAFRIATEHYALIRAVLDEARERTQRRVQLRDAEAKLRTAKRQTRKWFATACIVSAAFLLYVLTPLAWRAICVTWGYGL